MRIDFFGGAGQVTGSMYRVTLSDGYNLLIDCGLNYESDFKREENAHFPFDPSDVQLVLLTHAHLDHSGNLPTLFSAGYEGKVFCTEPTWTLCELLLTDSAKLEAARVQRFHKRRKKSETKEAYRLYGQGDVRKVIDNTVTMPFGLPFEVHKGLSVTFIPAGHILGAATIVLEDTTSGVVKRIAFTGDLGNNNSLITVDPEIPPNVEVLIMETTYGSRSHVHFGDGEEILYQHILETCIQNKGRLIIPAFSVGRTQAILYALNRLYKSGRIKNIPVFADSPMGITSSDIHARFQEYLHPKTADFLSQHHTLFAFKELYVIEDKEDVAYMQTYFEPYIIVSSAGMLEGGRIQHHIKNNLLNPACNILIAGYCTPNTLGHTLLSGVRQVTIKGKEFPVFAKVSRTDAFSAHPDKEGLRAYLNKVSPNKVVLVHGDIESLQTFKDGLRAEYPDALIPEKNSSLVI